MYTYLRKEAQNYCYLSFGTFLVALAINMFLASHQLVFGGVSGLGIVIESLTGISISTINVLINAPLFIFGAKYIGKDFLAKSIFSTVMLSAFLSLTSPLRFSTADLIVSAIFGGVLLGVGVGIVVKSGGSTGGTDMFALILSKCFNLPLAIFMFTIDTLIILSGVILFGINNALYAIIVVFCISKTVNEVTFKIDTFKNQLNTFFHKWRLIFKIGSGIVYDK